MNHRCRLAALFLCLFVFLPVAYGQGHCNMNTITGTYAFNFTGSSTIVSGPAPDGLHWNALYAPIGGVGWLTVNPDGSANGILWMIAGTLNLGLDPAPWQATLTVNDDCTGVIEYYFGPYLLSERFVVLDNGREIRSVVMQTGVPTGTWLSTFRRIGGSCGQNKVHGFYLFECKTLHQFPVAPPNIFAGAFLMRWVISPGGDYTGTLFGKVGPVPGEFPVAGNITVHNDCTAEGTLTSPVMPGVNHGRGVFFDEGKRAYFLPLVNNPGEPGETPQLYGYCEITRIDRN